MENLGEKKGRKGRQDTVLKIYVRFVKCRGQMRGSVTTCSSMKDRLRGQMCNGRTRTKLRRTAENLKIQTARHMRL